MDIIVTPVLLKGSGMDQYHFLHKCAVEECPRYINFDDEPWCFQHSTDSGSSLVGYSAREAAASLFPSEVIEKLVNELKKINKEYVQLTFPWHKEPELHAVIAMGEAWLAGNPVGVVNTKNN